LVVSALKVFRTVAGILRQHRDVIRAARGEFARSRKLWGTLISWFLQEAKEVIEFFVTQPTCEREREGETKRR